MTRPDRTIRWIKPLLLSLLFCALPALAHPGHGPHGPDEIDEFGFRALGAGLAHPLSGLDHILTIVGLGLVVLTARAEPRALVPGLFAAALVGGFLMARSQVHLPLREPLLALTAATLGLSACFLRAGGWRLVAVVAAGLWNGNAHGAEMTSGLSGFSYALGFLVSHLALALGVPLVSCYANPNVWTPRQQKAGTALAVVGLVLCITRIG